MRKKVLGDGRRETQPDVVDHEWNPRSARLSSIRRVLVLHQVTRHFRDQPGEEFLGVQGAEQGQPFVVLDALHAPAGSAARGRAVRARNAGHPAGRTHAPNRTGRVSSGGGGEASKSNSAVRAAISIFNLPLSSHEHAQRLQKTTLRRHGAKPSSGAEIARARAVPLMSVRAQCCCTQPARATCWLAKVPARACGHCPCRGSAATRRHAHLTNPASPPSITTLVRCDCQLFSGLILDRAAFKGTGAFSPSLPASLLFPLERARWPQFHMTLHDGSQASTRLTMMLPRSQFPP